jgi:hypothetical protein
VAVVGTAYVVVQAITTGFTQQVQNALQGLNQQGSTSGNSVGKSFSRGAASGLSSADDAALELYKRLNLLIEKSYVMSAAGVALAQVLSTVASGLVVLVAQVGAAAPALIVLPSMFTAIAQAAITMKMAFKGIGAAVGSINKGSKGVSQMPALLEAASAAKDRLTRAKRSVIKAGERIIEVYDDELERIEQLKFSSEGAALSQKKAAIELEKARETLARVQDLPPNSRARRSAELAFAEADLNYRQAVDRNKDLSKEVDKVTQNGTLNKDQQVKNSKAYKDAVEAETDAVYEREKAQEAKNKADAKVASGGSGGGADPMADLGESAKEFAKYLASLKPLIDDLRVKIQDTLFPKLKDAIEILVKSGLFEILNEKLADTGTAIGNAAIDFAKLFSNPTNLKNFSDVLDTNNRSIGKMGTVMGNLVTSFITLLDAASPLIDRFTDWVVVLTDGWKKTLDAKNASGDLTTMFNNAGDVAAQLGDIFGNLFGAIMNIGKAATGPGSGGQLLFDFLEEATAKFKEWTGGALKDGSLEAFFKTTTENFIKLLEIIGIVVGAILKTGDDPGVSKFFDSLKIAVQTLADALGKLSEGGIAEGFGKFIENMAGFFAATAESGSIKTYFSVLNTALGLLVTIMSTPAFQTLFGVLATVHGARLAFNRLGKSVDFVTGYMKGAKLSAQLFTGNFTQGFKNAYNVTGKFSTALKAGITQTKAYEKAQKILWDAQKYGKMAFDGVKGALTKMGTAIKTSTIYTKLAGAATKVWAGIQAAFNAIMAGNPIALIIIGIIALIAIVIIMYKKFEWFRDFVHTVFDALKTGFNAVWEFIKVIGEKIGSFFAAIWGGIKDAWDAVWPVLVIAFKVAVGLLMLPFVLMGIAIAAIWTAIKVAFDLVWPLIWGAIKFAWESIIKPIFDLMLSLFTTVWNGIKAAFNLVWDGIKFAIDLYWNYYIKPIFDLMLTVFKLAWDGIKAAFTLVWDIIKAAISTGWGIIKPIFEAFGKIFGAVWDGIKKAFQTAWDFITKAVDGAKTIFSGIGDVIIKAFKSAINFIIRAWNAIEFKVPSVTLFGKTIGGFTLGLPDIPELAEGGVIRPSQGGTLARIGEAGRAERIEPLDANGLSKRDKALITMLSGGAGGINITVNPSPGMDEVELASLVSRQLAFQLRRGAA